MKEPNGESARPRQQAPGSSEESLAIIVMNYRRPRNIGRICKTTLEALPNSSLFVLDQAEDEKCTVSGVVPRQATYRRTENAGCIARLRLAAELPFSRFLAVDDDLFLTRAQVRQLAARQQAAPDRVHGIWGQKVRVAGKRLSVENSVVYKDTDVSVLNQAYAFSREQAVAALELAAASGFGPDEIRICDDILLSSAAAHPPRCHDLGQLTICKSADEPGVGLGTERAFHETRARLLVRLLELGRLHAFPFDDDVGSGSA